MQFIFRKQDSMENIHKEKEQENNFSKMLMEIIYKAYDNYQVNRKDDENYIELLKWFEWKNQLKRFSIFGEHVENYLIRDEQVYL